MSDNKTIKVMQKFFDEETGQELWTTATAAAFLDVSLSRISNLKDEGKLVPDASVPRFGGKRETFFYLPETVEAYQKWQDRPRPFGIRRLSISELPAEAVAGLNEAYADFMEAVDDSTIGKSTKGGYLSVIGRFVEWVNQGNE
jgi:hypothetical protein